jgi:hypothetical protein
VPRFPNIEPFIGSFLKASTDDEMVKMSKTANVIEMIDLMDNISETSAYHFVLLACDQG